MIDLPCFAAAPTHGKVAIGGRWEEALTFPARQAVTETDVAAYVGQSDEVACEAFFGQAFFGVRLHGSPDGLGASVRSFVNRLRSADSGAEFFAAVAEDFGLRLATEFLHAELGAEGAWHSVGAFLIPDPCAALMDLDGLWRSLETSGVYRDTVHPKALEFAYAAGQPHWFALPVSSGPLLERAQVAQALRSFCS